MSQQWCRPCRPNFSSVGCVAHAQATGYAEADAPVTPETDAPVTFTETPTLVTVDPDVWVVRDSDVPVYYVDNYYWVYRANVWHRSRSYDGGWARVEASVVPRTIVSRNHGAYVHYRGGANAPTRPAPREQLAGRSDNRKHEAERMETAREKHEERQVDAQRAEHGGGPANAEAARQDAERREAEARQRAERSETMARRRTTTGATKRRGSRARRTTDRSMRAASVWLLCKKTVAEAGDDKIPRLAASLSYYTVLSRLGRGHCDCWFGFRT